MERKFHGSESSLCGLFAPGNESAEERKGLESYFVLGYNFFYYFAFLSHFSLYSTIATYSVNVNFCDYLYMLTV